MQKEKNQLNSSSCFPNHLIFFMEMVQEMQWAGV